MAIIHPKNQIRDPMEDKIHEYIKKNLQVCVSTSGSNIIVNTYLDDELIHTSSCKGPSKPILPLY